MDKLEIDGLVAVIYSPGYGAGWSTWASSFIPDLIFDPEIALWVMAKDYDMAILAAKRKYPKIYTGGLLGAKVEWLPIGTHFKISVNDGYERIEILSDDGRFIA